MNAPSYNWIFTLNGIFHTLLTFVMLIILWIGWRRQRHIGFLLLAGWAFVAVFNNFASWLLWPFAQNLLRKILPAAFTNYPLVALPSILGSWVSFILLCCGLALLVLRDERRVPHAT